MGDLSPLARRFGLVGWCIARFPLPVLATVVATALALGSGMLVEKKIVDTKLFDSLLLRPGTRLQRESDWVLDSEEPGHARTAGTELTSARATGGTREILRRKNLEQVASFFEQAGVLDVSVEYRGYTFNSTNSLRFAGSQPYKFTVLDCFQEGAHDYVGDVRSVGAGLVAVVVEEFMSPFGNATVTPYNWCIYLRIGVPYAPSPVLDPSAFGECRKFIREEPPGHEVYAAAYEFHRLLAYNYARVSASSKWAWGCLIEVAQTCHPALSCCELSTIYSECAKCTAFGDCSGQMLNGTVSEASCALMASYLEEDSWDPSPYYDAEYSNLDECEPVNYYPMSSLFAAVVGGSTSIAQSTDLSSCSQRMQAMVDVEEVVEFAVEELYCKMFGPYTCAELHDFDWRFYETLIASEEFLHDRALSQRCAHWDGAEFGTVRLFRTLRREFYLGDGDDPRALQFVYLSLGYKTIRDNFRERGFNVSTKTARLGRIQFLKKWGRTIQGRNRGRTVKFGTYISDDAEEAAASQTFPELHLVIIAYCFIVGYTVFVSVVSGSSHYIQNALLGLAGVVVVFLGIIAGTGAAVYAGIVWNPIGVQVLPFLILGLGINDLFVFTHRYLEVFPDVTSSLEAVSLVMQEAGASVTITSASNVCVLVVSALVMRMRMIVQFSLMAACALIGTWFCILFGYSSILAVHYSLTARRTLQRQRSEFVESRRAKASQWAQFVAGSKKRSAIIVAGTFIVVAVCSGVGLPLVTLDYAVNYIFTRGSSPAEYWKTKLKYLSSNRFDVITGESDFPRKHPLLSSVADPDRYSLLKTVMDSKRVTPGQDSWYNIFIQYMYPCGFWSFADRTLSASEIVAACEASQWYGPLQGPYNSRCNLDDALTSPPGACGFNVSEDVLGPDRFAFASLKAEIWQQEGLSTPLIPACTAWPVQYFVCDGAPCFGPDEITQELYDSLNDTLVYGLHPDFFYDCINKMLRHDGAHELRSPGFQCHTPGDFTNKIACSAVPPMNRSIWRGEDGAGDMDYSRAPVWASNLDTGANWLTLIKSLRGKMNRFVKLTDLDAFPHGTFWTFYYQFRWIQEAIVESFGLSFASVFVLAVALFVTAQTRDVASSAFEAAHLALLVIVAIAVQILWFVALMGLTDLYINCFTISTVIISFGIAVEFVAHTAFGYLAAKGSNTDRAVQAIHTYLLPITDGAFTTFVGFAPIAASRYLYVVLYYFLIYAILIAVGFFTGVVFFPALLAVFGRNDVEVVDEKPVVPDIELVSTEKNPAVLEDDDEVIVERKSSTIDDSRVFQIEEDL